jgi:hypothetical protein
MFLGQAMILSHQRYRLIGGALEGHTNGHVCRQGLGQRDTREGGRKNQSSRLWLLEWTESYVPLATRMLKFQASLHQQGL